MSPYELGLAVLALTVLVWLAARTAVKAAVERALERKFREWEVRFSKLHERRVEVMEGMMDRLVDLKRALDAATGPQHEDDAHGYQHLLEATAAGNEAHRYFAARRYYLPKETADKVDRLLREMKAAWADVAGGTEGWLGVGPYASHKDYGELAAMVVAGGKAVREKLPPIISEVEGEFRRLVEEI